MTSAETVAVDADMLQFIADLENVGDVDGGDMTGEITCIHLENAGDNRTDVSARLAFPEPLMSRNPKELYRSLWPQLPSVDDICLGLQDLSLHPDYVRYFYNLIVSKKEWFVDENVFVAIWFALKRGSVDERYLLELKSMSSAVCRRCRKAYQTINFLSANGHDVLLLCRFCRQDNLCCDPTVFYIRLSMKFTNSADVPSARTLVHDMHLLTKHAAGLAGIGYKCRYDFSCASTNDNAFVLHDVIPTFLFEIEKAENYTYAKNGNDCNTRKYICKQSMHARKSSSASASSSLLQTNLVRDAGAPNGIRKTRRRESRRMEKCRGAVWITCKTGKDGQYGSITAGHAYVHERDRVRFQLSENQQDEITRLALMGIPPYQVCAALQDGNPETNVPWNRVYYRWTESIKSKFTRDLDPIQSLKLLARGTSKMRSIYNTDTPFALGMLTNLGERLVREQTCEELFIDSTYKTNSTKLELFTVLVSVVGTGFPMAYLFLQTSKEEGYRKNALAGFLGALRTAVPDLKPAFFFSDKDSGQMDAILSVFGLRASLCYWHMKRAIKDRLKEYRKKEAGCVLETEEKELMALVSRHFNQHPFICPGKTLSSIHSAAVKDIENLFSETRSAAFLAYLKKRWYDHEQFEYWGRRDIVNGIPFARTTMFVEGHWYVLKRNFLLFHNRPRCDFLLFLLDTRLMLKFEDDYFKVLEGDKRPSWWVAFSKEWRR